MTVKLPARLSGLVRPFSGKGRQLGYPTANIDFKTSLADGVYFGFAGLGDFHDHPAIIFIGVPTTMGDSLRRVEAYLLDIPDEDYYGQRLSLRIEQFHRANQTFASADDLRTAMQADEVTARQWFTGGKR